jgi:hypothetical protein
MSEKRATLGKFQRIPTNSSRMEQKNEQIRVNLSEKRAKVAKKKGACNEKKKKKKTKKQKRHARNQ